ncbi:MAG: thioredoxin [Caldilineales bacterium]|nr:thioredoxin [Caldilineales bacterium]
MAFSAPIHTSSQSIGRVLAAGLPVILVFWSDDCAPCRQLDPTLDRLAADFAGKLLVAKIDAAGEPDLVQRFGVTNLPGLIFTKGGQSIATASGAATESDLRRWCEFLSGSGERPPVPTGPSIALASPAPAKTPSQSESYATGEPIQLTDANFDHVINGSLSVLVDFWAPWCGPCHRIAPAVESLAEEFEGKLVVGKLNVDQNQRTAGRYGVMSIPTLIIFRNGKAIDSIVGAVPAQMLRQRVLPHVN